jgi:hypothetical protein
MHTHAAVRPETKRPGIERAALGLSIERGLRETPVRDIAAVHPRLTSECIPGAVHRVAIAPRRTSA